MNVVDSSFWIEYFANTEAGATVSGIAENINELVVPTITVYEVFKKLLFEEGEYSAKYAITRMKQGNVIHLDCMLSKSAAEKSIDHKLSMADSIIYATTLEYNCVLWTQDKHFAGLPSVNYIEKKK